MKRCCRCKQEKPLSEFYKNKSTRDGYSAQCKLCNIAYVAAYRQEHDPPRKPHVNLVGQRFGSLVVLERVSPPENKPRYSGFYWLCRCDCGNTRIVITGKLNQGRVVNCGCRRGGERHYEDSFSYVLSRYKKSATRRGYTWIITDDQAHQLFLGDCHYCGAHPSRVSKVAKNHTPFVCNGIDRKQSSIGYEWDNCVSCCTSCNMLKGKMDYDEFISLVSKICHHMESAK